MSTEALSYAIDENDHLIKVDEGYYRFAEENGWREAGGSLGRFLWIRIVARPGGRIVLFSARLRSRLLRELVQPLLDPDMPRADETIEMWAGATTSK